MKKITFDAHTSRCQTADTEEHTCPECGCCCDYGRSCCRLNSGGNDDHPGGCKLSKTLTPAELHQLRRLQTERRPEACLGCGLEHECSLHGCAVLRKAYKILGGKVCERA